MTSNNWIQSLRCLRCEASDLQWRDARDFDGERLPTDGALVCGNCGARYPIADRILDMHARDAALTLAGRSNQAPLTPFVYERMWRPRSLPILSGGRLSARGELQLLREWAPLQAHHLALDLGSATGLYARTLAAMDASATVVALDLAPNMLRASHLYARRAGVRNIAHLRAAADRLPFATASVNL
ncbi:MAG: class I SAM-dependent methyltransferase, partial [Chloroflexota bacterium]